MNGQCLCGTVRIEIDPPTEFCDHCHCQSCRKAHGAAFVTATAVPRAQFRVVAGRESLHEYESDAGHVRCFCRRCSSIMFSFYLPNSTTFGDSSGKTYVPLAVLDDPIDRLPTSHVSFEERVAWFPFSDELAKYRAKTEEQLE